MPASPPRGFQAIEREESAPQHRAKPVIQATCFVQRQHTRHLNLTGTGVGLAEEEPGNSSKGAIASDFGRIEFPSSVRAPAKWLRTGSSTEEVVVAGLVKIMMKDWRLPAPSVIISVTGGADTLEVNDKQKLVFRRGLLGAAKRASAAGRGSQERAEEDAELPMAPWIFTGGTNAGVMELVGRTMLGIDADVTPGIPCIGIAPYGIISQRKAFTHNPLSHRALAAADGHGGASAHQASKKRARLGTRYVYGSRPDDPTADAHELIDLESHHSNFLLVDDGTVGSAAFGSEIPLRTALTDYICNSCFGVDEDGDPLPKPPFVLLVVGGGANTFQMVLDTLVKARPVVCLPDCGGAALAIFQFVHYGFEGTDLDNLDPAVHETARKLLPQIKRHGEVEVGANKEPQLTFFSTDIDVLASNDLAATILSAVLSDCDKTVDAINLAVRWRDTAIIRAQLDESQEVDAGGISKAFQNALLGRDAEVVTTPRPSGST